ncbi:hypothetical protein [Nocardia camponoti]|uniref:Secreted protein n=1 Tax=Nocardia camponoti TaxID=1616106 RepID=A0A917QJ53_9NOCA|nr:hypothetical protein [Nocardia camponoti]GGK52765.1 hypothetical protein GCM10011591_25640 [Nocardia camponoti]
MSTFSTRVFRTIVAAATIPLLLCPALASADTGSADTGSAGIDILGDLLDVGSGVLSGSGGDGSSDGPTQPCNRSRKSGGAGVTTTTHSLGRSGPLSFVLTYETFSIPDRIQVFYQGAQVHDTGYVGDQINQGTGSATVRLPAGSATTVSVKVTGPSNTQWEYTVNCP